MCFGNGVAGLVPDRGGTKLAVNYRGGAGADGNVGEGELITLQSDWKPGEPVWSGSVEGKPVAVQVRPVPNGFQLSWRGTFAKAAHALKVSSTTVSTLVSRLEMHLGVSLLNRTTRSVALTEAGELLLARVGPALSDVGAALDQVRGLRAVPSGRLRINAPPPAIDLVMAPMVAPFLAAHPKIDSRPAASGG